jgi:uncharacterized membrane protein YkvA (DUF1232 family)
MEEEQTFRSDRERKFYRRLRGRVKVWVEKRNLPERWLEYLLVAPDLFVLLSRLALDSRVPAGVKVKVAAGLAYFLTPLDVVPDFLGPPGLLDDVVVAAWILRVIVAELNELDPDILEEHWEGEEDILKKVTGIIKRAEDVLGLGGLVGRLRSGKWGPGK